MLDRGRAASDHAAMFPTRIARRLHTAWQAYRLNRQVDRYQVDPRIRYPSYMPLDEFVDVERLKSLNELICAEARRSLVQEDPAVESFSTGIMKMRLRDRRMAGSKTIALTLPTGKRNYGYIDVAEEWLPSPASARFPGLMDFIATLPFQRTARMIIMVDVSGRGVTPHRDHYTQDHCHEFIWFRPNLMKRFFVYSKRTGEKQYVDSYTAWFAP